MKDVNMAKGQTAAPGRRFTYIFNISVLLLDSMMSRVISHVEVFKNRQHIHCSWLDEIFESPSQLNIRLRLSMWVKGDCVNLPQEVSSNHTTMWSCLLFRVLPCFYCWFLNLEKLKFHLENLKKSWNLGRK